MLTPLQGYVNSAAVAISGLLQLFFWFCLIRCGSYMGFPLDYNTTLGLY
jgi:hypothetical protein